VFSLLKSAERFAGGSWHETKQMHSARWTTVNCLGLENDRILLASLTPWAYLCPGN